MYKQKSVLLSVIVPVYKGEKFIAKNIELMKKSISKHFKSFEIIVVVDGIVDNTIRELKKVSKIKTISYKLNKGKGYALKEGFKVSNGKFITFIDADNDLHPEQLKNFIPYMTTADMVVGSKRHPFSLVRYPFTRRILSKVFQIYSWMILGVNLKDTQTGLKLMKREFLEVIMPMLFVKRYAFDLELCFLAQKQGFRVVECPVAIRYKFSGSGINSQTILGMLIDVLAIRYRYSINGDYQKRYKRAHFRK